MTWLVAVTLASSGLGCGSSGTSSETGFEGPGGASTAGGGGAGGFTTGTSSATASGGGQVGSGILTAGMWDDNLNYAFFGRYLAGHQQLAGNPAFLTADYDGAHGSYTQHSTHTSVDAALVIDTTGSMSDELSYLTAEFANVWGAIAAKFPSVSQRWSLVVYRDTPDTDPGDDYVVKSYDFMTTARDFATTIGEQTAANGGDYPESPELGLQQLKQLAWRTDPSVANVAFWVGDAPHHDYRAAQMKQAILDVRAAGVRIYPVSASGTNDLLELTMRSAAQLTGGRYMFLTDDSGVGDPHKIPEIPCYTVTKLAKALVRAVAMELSGTYAPPDPADILRVEGNPATDGKCTTPDGQTVQMI
jgi:hypothetical protein